VSDYPYGNDPQRGYPQPGAHLGGQPYQPYQGYRAYGPPPVYGQPAYGQPPQYGVPPFGQPAYEQPSEPWYARWWPWLLPVLALAIVVGLFLATRPTYSLEKRLTAAIEANGDSVSALSCPSGIKTAAPHVYTCTATVDGIPATLQVRFVGRHKFVATYVS
jgi:Domain of unknown function (DUF4333)